MAFIARLTLKSDGHFLPAQFDLCIVCGNKGPADFILNVLLFVPFGFGLRLAGVRRRAVFLTALLLTISIETLQYWVVTGRDSGLNDIVANSLGGWVGALVADATGPLLAPAPAVARRMAALAALAWCAIAALTQWILQPALPPPSSIYYEQVSPNLAQFAIFDGVVLDATFNGRPFQMGPLSAEASAAVRAALLDGNAQIHVRALPGRSSRSLSSMVSVFDRDKSEIFVLGRRHDDVLFRLRRHSQNLGFLPVSVSLPHVFPPPTVGERPVDVTVTVLDGSWIIDAKWPGGSQQGRLGNGVWQGWRLFIPDDYSWFGEFAAFFTVAWIMGLCAPMGYWAGRAALATGMWRAAAVPFVALILALAIIPMAAHAPAAPRPVWVAGIASVALAWGIARWIDA